MRNGNGPDGLGSDPFLIFSIGALPPTICVSPSAILRVSTGGTSHIFGCPEAASISNKLLTCVSSCIDPSLYPNSHGEMMHFPSQPAMPPQTNKRLGLSRTVGDDLCANNLH